eukprot:4334433-Pleurochrysis_carterae.AAC.2
MRGGGLYRAALNVLLHAYLAFAASYLMPAADAALPLSVASMWEPPPIPTETYRASHASPAALLEQINSLTQAQENALTPHGRNSSAMRLPFGT